MKTETAALGDGWSEETITVRGQDLPSHCSARSISRGMAFEITGRMPNRREARCSALLITLVEHGMMPQLTLITSARRGRAGLGLGLLGAGSVCLVAARKMHASCRRRWRADGSTDCARADIVGHVTQGADPRHHIHCTSRSTRARVRNRREERLRVGHC